MFHDHPVAAHWLHLVAAGWAVGGPPLFVLLLAVGWWTARRRHAGAMAAAIWAPAGAVAALLADQPLERSPQVQPSALHLANLLFLGDSRPARRARGAGGSEDDRRRRVPAA